MKKTDRLITACEVNHILSEFLKKGQTPFTGNLLPCKAEIMTRYHVDSDLLTTYADTQPVRFGDIAGKTATRNIQVALTQADRPCTGWLNLDIWFTGYGKINVCFSGIRLTETEAGETQYLEIPEYAKIYQIDYIYAAGSINAGLSRPATVGHPPYWTPHHSGESENIENDDIDNNITFKMITTQSQQPV